MKKYLSLQAKKLYIQMDLTFADKDLKKCALDKRKCQKKMGKARAELYLKRIGDLYAAETLEDVRYMPGYYHELSHDRKGQWACDLDQPYRLVFRPHEDPIPEDENHKYIWAEILGVEIVEIVNYHNEK